MSISILVLLLVVLVSADFCGGNCPIGNCPTCYCGTTKNIVDVAQWCSKSTWEQSCCKCIVSHESGGNANAMNYEQKDGTDVGLWKINRLYWGQCNSGKAPCEPKLNLDCAIVMYNEGKQTWKMWESSRACGC